MLFTASKKAFGTDAPALLAAAGLTERPPLPIRRRSGHACDKHWQVAGRDSVKIAAIAFLLVLPLNQLTWLMSIPAVILAASYPFTKRFFPLPQAYLGIAFGFGIPMAFAAVQGAVPVAAQRIFDGAGWPGQRHVLAQRGQKLCLLQ